MEFYVICDYRDNFRNYSGITEKLYNDHPDRKNIGGADKFLD